MNRITAASLPSDSGIHSSGHFWPPEVDSRHDRTLPCPADHHVMEMGHDEVRFREVDIQADRRKKDAGQATDGKQSNKSERIEHGRIERG